MNQEVLWVVPEAPLPDSAGPAQRRRIDARALRLGILDNSKGNADHLLAFLVEGLRSALPIASVVSRRKPGAAHPATDEVLDELARDADCVVSAMAD